MDEPLVWQERLELLLELLSGAGCRRPSEMDCVLACMTNKQMMASLPIPQVIPSTAAAGKIHAIYRYPVKGLSPESLARTDLAVQDTLPGDRLYAIENGPSGFDPAAPRHQPKQRYLMLMRNERLARLRTRFDHANHTLAIEAQGREV